MSVVNIPPSCSVEWMMSNGEAIIAQMELDEQQGADLELSNLEPHSDGSQEASAPPSPVSVDSDSLDFHDGDNIDPPVAPGVNWLSRLVHYVPPAHSEQWRNKWGNIQPAFSAAQNFTNILSHLSFFDQYMFYCAHRSFQPLARDAIRLQKITRVAWDDLYLLRMRMQVPFVSFAALRSISQNADNLNTLAMRLGSLESTTQEFMQRIDVKVMDLSLAAERVVTQVQEGDVEYEVVNNVGLRDVDLSSTDISNPGLAVLAHRCSGLKSLKLQDCQSVLGEGIERIAFRCSLLTHLDVRSCPQIGERSFSAISTHCHNLTDFRASNNHNLEDGAIIALAQSARKLRTLFVNNCPRLTDASLNALAANSGSLVNIGLQSNANISVEGTRTLLGGCPLLLTVDLRSCNQIPLSKKEELLQVRNDNRIQYLLSEDPVEEEEEKEFEIPDLLDDFPDDPEREDGASANNNGGNRSSDGSACCVVM